MKCLFTCTSDNVFYSTWSTLCTTLQNVDGILLLATTEALMVFLSLWVSNYLPFLVWYVIKNHISQFHTQTATSIYLFCNSWHCLCDADWSLELHEEIRNVESLCFRFFPIIVVMIWNVLRENRISRFNLQTNCLWTLFY